MELGFLLCQIPKSRAGVPGVEMAEAGAILMHDEAQRIPIAI